MAFKRSLASALALSLVLGLSGCSLISGGVTTDDARIFIQGELDCTYKGIVNDDYLEILEMTAEEALEYYDSNVEQETSYLMSYISAEYPTDEQIERAQDLVREIYSSSKYEVGKAEKLDSGAFIAEVKVYPIDVMLDLSDSLQEIWDGVVGNSDLYSMSDAEYEALDQTYTNLVLDELESLIPSLGYEKVQTTALRLELDESDNTYYMSETDWVNLDYMIIDYTGAYE